MPTPSHAPPANHDVSVVGRAATMIPVAILAYLGGSKLRCRANRGNGCNFLRFILRTFAYITLGLCTPSR
jgi:hypothetical protein